MKRSLRLHVAYENAYDGGNGQRPERDQQRLAQAKAYVEIDPHAAAPSQTDPGANRRNQGKRKIGHKRLHEKQQAAQRHQQDRRPAEHRLHSMRERLSKRDCSQRHDARAARKVDLNSG